MSGERDDREFLLKELAGRLRDLVETIRNGRKGRDFAVRGDDDGIDRYEYTELESAYCATVGRIREIITGDAGLLTGELRSEIARLLHESSPAEDSFRGRTPAYGGDWQDIDSPVKCCVEEMEEFLRGIEEREGGRR